MIAGNVTRSVLLRDLRRDRSIAPGGDRFPEFARVFLPLVYGAASLLVPENRVPDVTLAVFRSFASRWRSLPKRTVAATWLLRTCWFASARVLRGLPAPPEGSAAATSQILFRGLNQLRAPFLDAVVLRCVLGETEQDAGRAMRRKETRVTRLTDRGVAALAKRLRKKHVTAEPRALMAGICSAVPAEIETSILNQIRDDSPRGKKDDLTRATLRTWRWVGFKSGLRRFLRVAGATISILAVLVFTLAYLANHGYLTLMFVRMGNRQLTTEFPDLTQPARPWPTKPPTVKPPSTAAELYSLTNIWITKLTFTPEQWRAIEPAHIQPVPLMRNGVMMLRNPNSKRNGLAGVMGIEFNYTSARMEFAGMDFTNVAARYRGNGTYVNSLYGPKQSFKVEANKFEKGRSVAGVHTLNFVNSVPDNSYLHDALAELFFRDLGVPAPRTAYSYLSVNVPGAFGLRPLGLYVLIENIDSNFASDRFGSKAAPIFKPVTTELFKDLGGDWKTYSGIYDLKTKATPAQLDRLIQFCRLVTASDDAEFARRLPEFLDLEEFAGFLAGHVLLSSYDGFLRNGQNFYVYLNPLNNKFGFIPWDQDHSWGEFGYVATADERERASIWDPMAYRFRFLERVLKVEGFRAIYRTRLGRAMSELFRVDRLYAQIDRMAAILRPAVAAESSYRLGRFDAAVSSNWVGGPRDGTPEGPRAPIHQMKRFVANRVQSVRDQLAGKARGVVLPH